MSGIDKEPRGIDRGHAPSQSAAKGKDTATPRKWADHESHVITLGNTFRGVRYPADMFGVAALGVLPSDLEGKVVVDVGSGLGGIATSASIEGIDTRVVSVNPSLQLPSKKQLQDSITGIRLSQAYPDATSAQIAEALRVHDANLSTSFAHDLSDIDTETADLVIDNIAAVAFMPHDKDYFKTVLYELLRITKTGGEILVGHGRDEWLATVSSEVLKQSGFRYEVITKEGIDGITYDYGFKIYKTIDEQFADDQMTIPPLRSRQIVNLFAQGKSFSQISRTMFVSETLVETAISLQGNHSEAVLKAVMTGNIDAAAAITLATSRRDPLAQRLDRLTDMQRTILETIISSNGAIDTNAAIAQALQKSESTIKHHFINIYSTLGTTTKAQTIAIYAIAKKFPGLIE